MRMCSSFEKYEAGKKTVHRWDSDCNAEPKVRSKALLPANYVKPIEIGKVPVVGKQGKAVLETDGRDPDVVTQPFLSLSSGRNRPGT
jgi:hypothetical protein